MHLILELVGPEAAELGPNRRRVFMEAGGTIGRAPDSDWMLPKQFIYIARRHAVIRYANGDFYMVPTGVTGVAKGEPDRPHQSGETIRLADGDRIFIADHEVTVRITHDGEQ